MANIQRDRRAKAGMRLFAAIAAAGGRVAEKEMARLSRQAGYLDGRGWPRYLSGKPALLERRGDGLIVLTEPGLRALGKVVLRRTR